MEGLCAGGILSCIQYYYIADLCYALIRWQ